MQRGLIGLLILTDVLPGQIQVRLYVFDSSGNPLLSGQALELRILALGKADLAQDFPFPGLCQLFSAPPPFS